MYIAEKSSWYLERVIWLVAGSFTLISAILAWLHNPLWLLFTGFVGMNLIIFSLTGFCIMANFLVMLGFKSGIKKN